MASIIYIVLLLLIAITMVIVSVTCFKINKYINMKTDEAYRREAYENAKRDLREINDQLNQKEDLRD
jgi:NADH:ubiquinone oxidoreductase subunit 3 (subunit A)